MLAKEKYSAMVFRKILGTGWLQTGKAPGAQCKGKMYISPVGAEELLQMTSKRSKTNSWEKGPSKAFILKASDKSTSSGCVCRLPDATREGFYFFPLSFYVLPQIIYCWPLLGTPSYDPL